MSSCQTIRIPKPARPFELTPAPYFDSKTGIYFPGALGPLFRRPVVNLEERNPGLGLAISYQNEDARIDIFVFDLRASIIPKGIESEVVNRSFQEAKQDLSRAERRRIYSQLELDEDSVRTVIGTPFLEAHFSYIESFRQKEGYLLVAGVNGQIVKIRAVKMIESEADLDRLLAYVGHSIAQSQRNGYGGISEGDYRSISKRLEAIQLTDGLSNEEAIAIAQMELVRRKEHNRYDPSSAQVVKSGPRGSKLVQFEQFPTQPGRISNTPMRIEVSDDGSAQLLD